MSGDVELTITLPESTVRELARKPKGYGPWRRELLGEVVEAWVEAHPEQPPEPEPERKTLRAAGIGVTAASIQLEAAECSVAVKEADHPGLIGVWFLTLSTVGGYICLSGSLEELRQLANRIAGHVEAAEA